MALQFGNKESKIYRRSEKLYEKGLKLINKSDPEGKEYLLKALQNIRENKGLVKLKNDDFSKLLVNIGLTFQKAGDIKNAADAFKIAINMDRGNVDAYTNYAMIRALQKDYKKAIFLVEKALQIDLQNRNAWETKAEIYQLKGDIDEALDIYKKLINLYPEELKYYEKYLEYRPKDIEILFKMGVQLYKIQSYAECVRVMKDVVNINAEYQQAWVYLGAAYAKMDRMVDAINALKKAISIDPNDKRSWINLAILHKKRGEYEEALRCIREAIKIDPNDKKSWYLESSILHLMERNAEALKAVNRALEHDKRYLDALALKRELAKKLKNYADLADACVGLLDMGNNDLDIMYDLAYTYFKLDKLDRAFDITQNILKEFPKHLPSLKLQRDILKSKEQWDRVISVCEDILRIEPNDVESLVDEAIAYRNLGKLESSLNFIIRATEIEGSNIELWKLRKDIAKELNKPQEIITASTQIISMGGDFETYRDLARAYYTSSRYDEAKKILEKGLKMKDDDDEGWNLLGMIYYKLGDLENARYSFKKATAINPNEKKYWKNLAWTMEKLDKFDEAVEYYEEALKLDPNDMRLWYERGLCLKKIKRYEDALESFDSALKINENFTKAMFEKGDVLLLMKRYDEAIKIFNTLVKIEPTNSKYIYKRAYARFRKKEYEAALKDVNLALDYERRERYMELKKDICKAQRNFDCVIETTKEIITMNKKNLAAWRDLAYAYDHVGKIDSAIATYREALEIYPDNEVLLYELKDLLMKHERYADAVEICKNILSISPEDYKNLMDLGKALINLKKYDEAKEYLLRSAKLNKNSAVLEFLGDANYNLKKYDEAIENYIEAINLEERPELYHKLAKAYYRNGDIDEAINSIQKAIQLGKEARFYLLASRIYVGMNKMDMAYEHAKKALEMEDSEDARINLANILLEMENYDEIIKLLKPLAKENNINALRVLGRALEADGRFEEALKIYQRVVNIDKRDKNSWLGIARCSLALKDYENAIKAYERAHLLDPKDPETYKSLAFAYQSAGDYKKALEYLDKGIELAPEDAHIWTSRGFVLIKMDDLEGALKSFEKALEINPEMSSAQEGKLECERIIENRELEKYAKKILLHEYRTGRRVTKKEAFKDLNVPLAMVSKVFNYIKLEEPLNIDKLTEKEMKDLERKTYTLAKKLKRIKDLTLAEIVANTNLDVKSSKRLLSYIEQCFKKDLNRKPTKEDEILLRKVLDLDLKNKSVLNLMINLEIGLCHAKFLRNLLLELEEDTETPVDEHPEMDEKEPAEREDKTGDSEEEFL
ncbi:tetratricopeptide repeat protein [Aciduliprofundum sp. MAR08-339]|uniref:tetratricopeptide repeat protein n=1 Tax=Aciduliprofundum sp. (strain MAR08-339) TaxID=673860 RepID=UPI0002A4C5C8|nr:tetratricopeptide repeat protein [Aciduliprofundum sp. MAR08-339]